MRRAPFHVIGVVLLAGLAVAADPGAIPPGKTFTWKATNTTLGTALDELARQTGVDIDRSEAEVDRALKIDCAGLTFWNALDRIARESDHQITFADGGKRLQLRGGGDIVYRETPSSVDRVFRVTARRVRATSDLESDQSFVEVVLSLQCEPGFRVFLVDQPGRSASAKDNADQDLRVGDEGGRVATSGSSVDLTLRLAGVPRTSRAIKQLEGKFGVIGAAGMLDFAFTKPVATPDNRVETKEDVKVGLRTDFRADSDLWTARVEFEYPAGGPSLESYESAAWLVDNKAWLVKADGKTTIDNNGGYEVLSQGDRKAVVLYRFTDDVSQKLGKPEDWTLRITTPRKLLSTDVKYRLDNIPLP